MHFQTISNGTTALKGKTWCILGHSIARNATKISYRKKNYRTYLCSFNALLSLAFQHGGIVQFSIREIRAKWKGRHLGREIFILTSITSLSHPYVSGGGKKIWYEGKNVSIGALDRSVSASVNRTNRIKERISCFTIEGVGIFLPSSLYSISLVLYTFNRRGCLSWETNVGQRLTCWFYLNERKLATTTSKSFSSTWWTRVVQLILIYILHDGMYLD